MVIGVLKEPSTETRTSMVPEVVSSLVKKGHQVWVEYEAGASAYCSNFTYVDAGATLTDRTNIIQQSDVLLSIQIPSDIEHFPSGKVLIGTYMPLYHKEVMEKLALKGVTIFSLDMLPRTTRAQSMDVLSSQANIAGYKAVLLAASLYPRYFPMFMTAAGSIPPAKVLILGAGVAGLQAIATSRRLGAIVEVFDTRPTVKEEVMSLGAKFVEVEGAADASKAGGYAVEQSEEYQQKQRRRIEEAVKKADIVITTAQIPGKKAPILITEQMIEKMRQGSIIIDLAASTGGNTPYTKNRETIDIDGVRIIGNSDLAGSVPYDASKLYSKNISNFLALIISKENNIDLNFSDELVMGSCITHNGAVIHERLKS